MESSIRILYDAENEEYCVEAYDSNSEHFGTRTFKAWSQVIAFLEKPHIVAKWLICMGRHEISDHDAAFIVRMWPK